MSDSKGMDVLIRAAEILRRHAARTRYESRMSGMVAGERIAMQAEVWEQAARRVEELARDAH